MYPFVADLVVEVQDFLQEPKIWGVSNSITFPATITDQEYHILRIGESVSLDLTIHLSTGKEITQETMPNV